MRILGMAQPFQQLPGKDDRRVENSVPGLCPRRRSLGWTPSKKQLKVAQVLEVFSLFVGVAYLGSFLILPSDALNLVARDQVGPTLLGLSFFSLTAGTLLLGLADMLSGGRARLSGWVFWVVMPIAVFMIFKGSH